MSNPYYINEPAAISFSGGRTSAFMLWKILEAHGGTLPDYVKVLFANTGKEHWKTLQFVGACSRNWGVPIVWVEYAGPKKYRITDIGGASRNGEPFAQLIEDKNYLPNPMARFCTSELKVVPINSYMADNGFDDFLSVVGIRADEPRRVAKQRAKEDYLVPLADDGIVVADVMAFWQRQNFDLGLHPSQSNCDLCFLKGQGIKLSLLREEPRLANWWIQQEEKIGARFRKEHGGYERLKVIATDQGNLFDFSDESIGCFCGD